MNTKKSNLLNSLEIYSFAENLRPLAVKNYILRKQGQAIVLAFNSGARNIINHTGKDILEMCDGKNSIKKISETIASKYKIDFQKILKDIISFIYQLAGHGAISFKKDDLQKLINKKKYKKHF